MIDKGAWLIVMNLQDTWLPQNETNVLFASSGDQISSPYDEKGHGPFACSLLKGIKNENIVKPEEPFRPADRY